MPFESSALELVFLSIVALVVVGPKDLPVLLRKLGQFTAKMRGLAAEFRSSFDEMARQSELDELRKEVEALRTGQFASGAAPAVEEHLAEINAHLTDTPPALPAPAEAPLAAASPERQGTPPLPILSQAGVSQAGEPRFTDGADAEPLLPFDGPAGEEAYREESADRDRRRSRDTLDDAPSLPFDGPAGEEAYREDAPARDRRRSRDTVDDASSTPFDAPSGDEGYREDTRHVAQAPAQA